MSTLFIKYSAIRKEQWPSLPATNKCMYKTVIQVLLVTKQLQNYGKHGTLIHIVTDW